MKAALYARVSTDDKDQNPETQLLVMRQFCRDAGHEIYQEYVDQARARDWVRRIAWAQLQRDAHQHKFQAVLVVHLDRAFRTVRECCNTLEDWQERGIGFRVIRQDAIDTTTSMGRFALHVLAAAAELESALIGERVAAGISRVQASGHHWGRPALNMGATAICNALLEAGTVSGAARKLDCSRAYIHKVLLAQKHTPAEVLAGKWVPPMTQLSLKG